MVVTLLWLAACETTPPAAEAPATLDAVALLSRASLDIRGRRPTEAELVAVEADPASLDAALDAFMLDDGFPERLVALYNEVFRTKTDIYLVNLKNDVQFEDEYYNLAFRHSVGEEPERLVAWLAANDLPWTDMVLADYTMADDRMLAHLPMESIDEGVGWRPARYLDDRPAGGILVMTGMWWRYTSTYENANRGRAQIIAKSLLCDDRFEAAVSFQGTSESLDARTQTDPTCLSCHASLDPLAAYFWGFMLRNQEAWLEATRYDSAGEGEWIRVTGVGPGYYGQPGTSLVGLGDQIAADPRFVNCAVETGSRFLLGEGLELADAAAFEAHRETFLDSGLTLRALYRSLLDDPRYRAAEDDADPSSAPRHMRADQKASSIEALTGYRWTWQGNDMLDIDEGGVRVLAGGVDGIIATQANVEPSTTALLVHERLAEAAAQWAVQEESAQAADARILLRELDPTLAEPDDDALTAQLVALYLRMHGRRVAADDDDVTTLAALWRDQVASGVAPADAWADVLSALLRHPDFVTY